MRTVHTYSVRLLPFDKGFAEWNKKIEISFPLRVESKYFPLSIGRDYLYPEYRVVKIERKENQEIAHCVFAGLSIGGECRYEKKDVRPSLMDRVIHDRLERSGWEMVGHRIYPRV